jgi:excisionase family DNA binding protein
MGELVDLGQMEPVYTVGEIAAMLRVSKAKVRRDIDANVIKGFRVGREKRVKASELRDYFVRIGYLDQPRAASA